MSTPFIPEPHSDDAAPLGPQELRDAMRQTLQDTLEQMDSDEFLDHLESLPAEERKRASLKRGEIYRTWRRINNQQLEEIRAELEANGAELRQATRDLQKSLASVEKAAAILDASSRFLTIATRVFVLVG